MSTPPEIITLIQRFQQNINEYQDQRYNETEVRVDFINPFFRALGWDIENTRGELEVYRDVIHEDKVKVGNVLKAPDYSFWIDGIRKFFVEAKKPGVKLKTDTKPAFQLRRYGWSAGLPLSILTNFAELVIYDCRVEPKENEDARNAQLLHIPYTEYDSRWNEISDLLSREAVRNGSLEKYAEANKALHGSVTVDKAFLKLIEHWREILAYDIEQWDRSLVPSDLNYAVQMTIDRLVFLRICEDRGIEEYGRLLALVNGGSVYARLTDLLKDADKRYNSGLFHFSDERGRGIPDKLTLRLQIGDEVLQQIIRQMYSPSPYAFDVIPIEILGNVYEQFLGKVIQVNDHKGQINGKQTQLSFVENRIEIVEKPEVRKAGGVYYTPTYIVDYIVKNTVGKLLEGKNPRDVANLRILDPACGSGSFLIGAYQYLLDWHRDWYVRNNPQRYPTCIVRIKDTWRLTTEERKRILTNNIYGVDIDYQAVETTKLSLLLRVLEGETNETLKSYQRRSRARALPDLDNNIKYGNSLIGSDFYHGKRITDLDEETRSRINIFDWQTEFAPIMKAGGFDAVIGNPPYGAYLYDEDKEYLTSKFTEQSYQLDTYLLFLEASLKQFLHNDGFYGVIIPNPWLTNLLQQNIRRLVTRKMQIREIVHFKFPVFAHVTVDTEIVILQKKLEPNSAAKVTIVNGPEDIANLSLGTLQFITHEQGKWAELNGGVINIFVNPEQEALAKKCLTAGIFLEKIYNTNVGIKPYQVGKGVPKQTAEVVETRPFDSNAAPDDSYRACLRGSDIQKYKIEPLEKRFLKYGRWLAEPRPAANFDAPIKIFVRQTGDSLVAALDTQQYLCLNNMHVLVPKKEALSPYYVIGLLNSNLLNWYYHTLNPEVGEALAEVKKTNVAKLPIRTIDFGVPTDKSSYDKMIELVEQMLTLQDKLTQAITQNDITQIQRQIASTDQEIDTLVYELYGLTDKEIQIVENE